MYDIRVAVEEGGFSCDPWVVRGGNDFDIESADCTDQAVFAVFAVYDNASLIKEQRDVRLGLIFAIYDRVFNLTSPNWNVYCGEHRDICEQLLPLLGGEVIISEAP